MNSAIENIVRDGGYFASYVLELSRLLYLCCIPALIAAVMVVATVEGLVA